MYLLRTLLESCNVGDQNTIIILTYSRIAKNCKTTERIEHLQKKQALTNCKTGRDLQI